MKDEQIYNSDEYLISALKQRDRNAFKYLYKNYTGPIKHFVKTNGGQDVDAEEIEQNVIVLLYEKIASGNFVLNEGTKLSTYMFAVGKNINF
jgi:DNA-directed RNA polymerase specialized sigma24 family protein